MKLIGQYLNGNNTVLIFDNGTKIRTCKDEVSYTDFPETIDLKITNRCNYGCPFCHENSTPDGEIANIHTVYNIIRGMHTGTEIALGGGSLTTVGEKYLEKILICCYQKGIIVNATFKLEEIPIVKKWNGVYRNLYGIGVSFIDTPENRTKLLENYDKRMVIHVINGIVTEETLNWLAENNFKVLVLGYKNFRRGVNYLSEDVYRKMASLSQNIDKYFTSMNVISFDNLALEQLKIKEKLSKEKWEQSYMGDEGSISMFIDAVNNVCGKNSITPEELRIKFDFSIPAYALNYLSDENEFCRNTMKDLFQAIKKLD